MKANVITKYGEAWEVFAMMDMAIPEYGPEEVLVKVYYTSVNPLDCRIRKTPSYSRSFPMILGFDVYGEIIEKGRQVKDLSIGDAIIASPSPFKAGANAPYIVIKANMCLQVTGLDPKIGAAIPLAGITAYEALFDRLKIKEGDLILIHAGAGGVGHLAIQLAKDRGCQVITTASREESISFCQHVLKADYVINYKTTCVKAFIEDLTNKQGVKYILDTVGGETFQESLTYLSPGGHLCTILPVHYEASIGYSNLLKNITISYEFMGASALYNYAPFKQREILADLVAMIKQKRLQVHISKVYSLEDLALAHHALEQKHTTGKIVISVDA